MKDFWNVFCEINLTLSHSQKWVISSAIGETTFSVTDTKLYVPVETLSTKDNFKMLELLKAGFERTFNWNKYQSKRSIQRRTHI